MPRNQKKDRAGLGVPGAVPEEFLERQGRFSAPSHSYEMKGIGFVRPEREAKGMDGIVAEYLPRSIHSRTLWA